MTEEFFIKLAGIRKVRTPGGAAYFDLPIGAPITADVILKAKKKHALQKGGTASSSGSLAGPTSTSNAPKKPSSVPSKASPAGPIPDHSSTQKSTGKPLGPSAQKLLQANGAAVVHPKPVAVVQNSSLSGPKKFKIGQTEFNVPAGSRLFRSKSNPDRAFLIDPDGKGHVFNEKGEVKFPDVYMEVLANKLKGDLTDTDYVADVFESDDSGAGELNSQALSDMEAGQVLRDSDLVPQFTKQSNGLWKHSELDIDLTDEQLQPLFDSGQLQATTPEQDDDLQDVSVPKEISFGKFKDSESFQNTLDQYESGDQIVLDMGLEADPEILTKGDDGKWAGPKGISLKPSNMYAFKDKLSGISPEGQKGDQEKLTPEDVEADDVPEISPGVEDVLGEQGESGAQAPESKEAVSKTGDSGGPEEALEGKLELDSYVKVANKLESLDAAKIGSSAVIVHGDGTAVLLTKTDLEKWTTQKGTNFNTLALQQKNLPLGSEAFFLEDDQVPNVEAYIANFTPDTEGPKQGDYSTLKTSTKIKIGELKAGMMVDGGEILSVTDSKSFPGKLDVTYKSKYNGATKKGSWWKKNDITIHPKDGKPVIPESEKEEAFPGIPNSEPFIGPLSSLKKDQYVFAKEPFTPSGLLIAMNRQDKDSWTRMDGNALDPIATTPIPYVNDDSMTHYFGDKELFVTDAEGLEAIRANNAQILGEAKTLTYDSSLTVEDLDGLEPDEVITVTTDSNKSPKLFVKTASGHWMDNKGNIVSTVSLPKGTVDEFDGSVEELDDFLKTVEAATGKAVPWLKDKQTTPEEDVIDSYEQHVVQIVDAPEPQKPGVKNLLTDGSNNPPNVPQGWKQFSADDIKQVPVGDFVFINKWPNGPGVELERTPNGFVDEDGIDWSFEDVLFSYPNAGNVYFTNDGAEKDSINNDGIASSLSVGVGSKLDVEGLQDVIDLPENMSISVGDEKYIPSASGPINSATGAPLTEKDLAGKEATVDNIVVGSKEGYTSAVGEFVPAGTPILTEADLVQLPTNALVHSGADDAEGMDVVKINSSTYLANYKGLNVYHDELVGHLNDGIPMTFMGMTDSPLADWEKELLYGPTPQPHGVLSQYTKPEILEAVKALENHTGFQISYGLKAVPENKVTKNQAALKELAQKEFPDLKPKPAFVSFLKKYGAIEDPKTSGKKTTGKSFSIGSSNPKKTGVQGWDGGSFSGEDIQDAINILEAFQGKNFKSELNKKNNPLGSLDPNPIVGFDKDKTKTKQKFIDYLKNTLGDEDPVAEIEDAGDQSLIDMAVTVVEANKLPDETKAQKFLSEHHAKVPEVSETESSPQDYIKIAFKELSEGKRPGVADWDNIPVGSRITSADYTGGVVFTKTAKNMWFTGSKYYKTDILKSYENSNLVFVHIPDMWGMDKEELDSLPSSSESPLGGDIEDISPDSDSVEDEFDIDSLKVGDLATPYVLASAKVGTQVAAEGSVNPDTYFFTKLENGKWKANMTGAEYESVVGTVVTFVPGEKAPDLPSTSDILINKASVSDVENVNLGPDGFFYDKLGNRFSPLNDGKGTNWLMEGDYPGSTAYPKVNDVFPTSFMSDYAKEGLLYREKLVQVSGEELNDLSVGTGLKNLSDHDNHLVKHEDSWYVHQDEDGSKLYPVDKPSILNMADKGLYMYKAGTDELSAPLASPEEKSKVAPGKYTTTGKVFMYVNSDGSGVYVDKTGTPKKLTKNAVQKNYDSGMNKYLGVEDPPKVDNSVLSKPAPKKVSSAQDIPDGVYYLGLAATGKATKVTVKDGEYTQQKYSANQYGKAGGQVSKYWMQNAAEDAKFQWSAYVGGERKYKFFVKQNGEWKNTVTGEAPTDSETYYYNTKILSNGYGDPSKAQKASLQSKFAQGQLLDQYGTSILPEGYTGSILFIGASTTAAELSHLLKDTTDPLTDWKATALKQKGVNLNNNSGMLFLFDQGVDVGNFEEKKTMGKYFHKVAQDLVADLVIEEPESNAAELFTFDAQGQAEMPLWLAASSLNNLSTSEISDYVEKASSEFGDGKIIGLHLSKKADKAKWLSELKQGNFKAMYQLEVASASEKGIPHAAGWMHPGYAGNADTNSITWGPAVKGEIPAGSEVGGEWTQLDVKKWSLAEVDNYLIKAQMQNPTYLSSAEKRQWVSYHLSPNKAQVDKLSAIAALRAQEGHSPVTDPLQWTEGIVPATEYDYLFDNKKHPSSGEWSSGGYAPAKAWISDNQDNQDFLDYWKSEGASQVGYSGYEDQYKPLDLNGGVQVQLVGAYFDHKEYLYQEELKKPVYSLVKKLKGGQGETWLAKDQFDRQAVFKPVDHSKKGADALFRVEVEASGNHLGKIAGFHVPDAKVGPVGENTGLIQQYVENQGDLQGVDLTTLTNAQIGQIAGHQVLDHFLQNDDTHHRNLMIDSDGNVVGIDKGRAFLAYGTYEGLAHDPKNSHMSYNMLASDDLVYAVLIDRMRAGDFTSEQAYEAYSAAMKAAKRISKLSDQTVADIVREGTHNRPNWGYKGYHSFASKEVLDQVPNNVDELIARVLQAKASMPEQVQAMYDAVFKAAGWDAPELPKEAIEGHTSGWQEASALETAFQGKVFGSAALHASTDIQGGSSLLWTEKNVQDKDIVKGELTLAQFKGQEVGAKLESLAGSGMTETMDPEVNKFPDLTPWKSAISGAGKDWTKNINSAPGNKYLNEATWASYEDVKNKILQDMAYYTPSLLNSEDSVQFPSGTVVPANYVGLYHNALEHYQGLINQVEEAKKTDSPTVKQSMFPYQPTALSGNFVTFKNTQTGEQIKKLANGQFLYISPEDGFQTKIILNPPLAASKQTDGWVADGLVKDSAGVSVKKKSAQVATGKLSQDGTFISDGTTGNGQNGYEFEITLPTGEVINYRHHDYTNSYKSQSNRLRFTLAGDDHQASLERVEDYLKTLDIDVSGADDPELLYWREMFHTVVARKGGGAEIESARKEVTSKAQQAGVALGKGNYAQSIHNTAELISKAYPEEELSFYRTLADKTWGKEKVAQWISEGRHLPKYQHMLLTDASANTGYAYFERIDADIDKLKSKQTLLGIQAKGADNAILKYITSGGLLSTEMRLRTVPHSGASQSGDQESGGANYVYARVTKGSNEFNSMGNLSKGDNNHVVFLSPEIVAHTSTFGYTSDNFGNTDSMTDSYYEASKLLDMTGDTNEVMIKDTLSIIDFIELMVFKDASKRNEAIQRMKALGWETLRGLPVEDRFVLRVNLKEALAKVKAAWKTN